MAECELVALEIVSAPGYRSSLGTPESLLKFSCPIDNLSYEMKTRLAQKNLDASQQCLQRLESRVTDGGGASPPAPTMQTTNQPSLAAITGTCSEPAQTIGTALPILPCPECPPLPRAFKSVHKSCRTGVPQSWARTDPEFYWSSCFQEILTAKRPLGMLGLNRLFHKRLEAEGRPTTQGHEHWFRHQNEQLLQLFAAAKLQIAPGTVDGYSVCSN